MSHDEKRRQELLAKMRDIGNVLREAVGKDAGFALFVFDWDEKGWLTYMSNAERSDMVRVLREHLERMEAGTDNTEGRQA